MPHSPPTLCSRPGCTGKRRNGVCDVCGPRTRTDNRSAEEQHRRAVAYGRRWRTFASRFLAINPLCKDCQDEGLVTAAREVHHKQKVRDRPDLQYDPENCVGLCSQHHSKRTARGE